MSTPEQPETSLAERLQRELAGFSLEVQACWTYDNPNTSAHALLRDCLAEIVRLRAERDQAMAVLDPSMPESGLVDACKQVKQVAISSLDTSKKLEERLAAVRPELTKAAYFRKQVERLNIINRARAETAEVAMAFLQQAEARADLAEQRLASLSGLVKLPKRIQRKRTKGWRMPEGVVYVGRGTQWGNPIRIGQPGPDDYMVDVRVNAVAKYRYEIVQMNGGFVGFNAEWVKRHLRGKDLACWCSLAQPCHADVLLEIANE